MLRIGAAPAGGIGRATECCTVAGAGKRSQIEPAADDGVAGLLRIKAHAALFEQTESGEQPLALTAALGRVGDELFASDFSADRIERSPGPERDALAHGEIQGRRGRASRLADGRQLRPGLLRLTL